MFSGKIRVDIHSEGSEDTDFQGIGSVKINTIERSLAGRGSNVVVLDKAGNYLASKTFDTCHPQHGANEGKRMGKFLQDLPVERIVAIATKDNCGE